jgi:hypothetical protein
MDYACRAPTTCPASRSSTAKGTPCTHNPLGVKGCGEAGAIGSPPAVINAICDALGVKDVPMPATPYTSGSAARRRLSPRSTPPCKPSTYQPSPRRWPTPPSAAATDDAPS